MDHEEQDRDSNYKFAMYFMSIQCNEGGNDLSLSFAIDWSSLHNKSLNLPDAREIRVPISVMRKK